MSRNVRHLRCGFRRDRLPKRRSATTVFGLGAVMPPIRDLVPPDRDVGRDEPYGRGHDYRVKLPLSLPSTAKENSVPFATAAK